MWAFIGSISFVASLVLLILGIIGKVKKKVIVKRSFLLSLCAFVLFIVAIANTPTTDPETNLANPPEKTKATADITNEPKGEAVLAAEQNKPEESEFKATTKPTDNPTVEPTPEPTTKETASQRNAVRTAKNYLYLMGFSRDGLIKQLEFEGYSKEDAAYAADQSGADWKEQAIKTAKNYLNMMAFSEQSLKEQLEFEGYTSEQAEYGVKKAYQ